jgi:3-deoxy-manno-octulosonate cytidylyltransferase (CMP-KDO synthetase)
MKIAAIIPARFHSTRFPGKPLIDIGGKTMIRRVYEQAKKASIISEVIVATDDQKIFDEVKNFGGRAILTSPDHNNGTERCAEVAAGLDADVIINVQGDEPFIHPEPIDLLALSFKDVSVQIATLIKQHALDSELQSPSRIKVAVNKNFEALYFSRSLIPFHQRGNSETIPSYYKHIGIYAFRKDVLLKLVKLQPTALELSESLEQLRWLENGYKIQCLVTQYESISIDTPADLQLIEHLLKK